jgi:hypothetical protein
VGNNLKIGDKVTFDTDKIEHFRQETRSEDQAVRDYQRLVLQTADQVGTVKECGYAVTTVSYGDGGDVAVPTKYLIVLPANL